MTTQDITADLEAMVDAHGLLHVLTGLSLVCSDKAAIELACTGSKLAARDWNKAAEIIENAARNVPTTI